MIRGTTAQFKFELPCMANELDSATIVFWQEGVKNDYLPIKKNLLNCSMEGKYLYVSLTDSETFMFSDKLKARVQLVANTRAIVDAETKEEIEPSVRFASRTSLITVHPINDEIVDENPEDTAPTDENGWVILDGQEITK